MRSYLITTLLILFLIAITGCTYDKESEVYPEFPSCDTAGNVSYNLHIRPIMTTHCNTCHGTISPEAGVITQTYDGLKVVALNGSLWAAVNWTGTVRMPKDRDQLPECDRAKIRKWVEQGAKDN